MSSVSTGLAHDPAHELLLPEDGPVRRLVVLLHGYGGDGREMMALARRMARRMTTAAFFCPDGGETCPEGVSGRAGWRAIRRRCRPQMPRAMP
jgi:phospholipase/carboxylesterase